MQSKASDGAASAAILAAELDRGLTELVEQGAHPQALSRAIESRTTAVLELISSVTSDIEFKEQIETVATTLTYDPTIGEILAEAWDKVGGKGQSSLRSRTPSVWSYSWSRGCSLIGVTSHRTS